MSCGLDAIICATLLKADWFNKDDEGKVDDADDGF